MMLKKPRSQNCGANFRVRPRGRKRVAKKHRQASVVLELLLSLPVLLIAMLAAIQFGMLFSSLQQLAMVSRTGARAAAETSGLPMSDGPVPASILLAVNRQMAQAGISSFGVLVEHNVAGPTPGSPIFLSSGSPTPTIPSTSTPPATRYVRVTVAVDLTEIMPDLLGFFGFNILGKTAQQTTVYPYEL